MSESIAVTHLTLDGIPTPFEQCSLDRDGDSWSLDVVGMYEAYGVPDKKGHTIPVSFDTPDGRHAGVALIKSVTHEDHSAERMIVHLEGVHPLR
ncbi:MAG TPA: hypothetical protein VFV00_03150 [Acidimicrobiales bacterium]|nr:hypothetical protein [Acidimicrobiales bacterium]